MIRWQLFKIVSTRPMCALCDHTGQQYSAVEYTNDSADVRNVEAQAPHVIPASFWIISHRDLSFPLSLFSCWLNVSDRSNVLPRYFGVKLYGMILPQNLTLTYASHADSKGEMLSLRFYSDWLSVGWRHRTTPISSYHCSEYVFLINCRICIAMPMPSHPRTWISLTWFPVCLTVIARREAGCSKRRLESDRCLASSWSCLFLPWILWIADWTTCALWVRLSTIRSNTLKHTHSNDIGL